MGGATRRQRASVGLSILLVPLLTLPIAVSCATTAPRALATATAHPIPLDEVGRQLAAIPDAEVVAQPTGLVVVTLPSDLVFADGRDLITSDGVERLRALAQRVAGYPDPLLRVKGHSDLDGSESYALQLSEDRAERVRAFLIEEGLSPTRVGAAGFGAEYPVATNDTEEGRTRNRRLEIEIQPDATARAAHSSTTGP